MTDPNELDTRVQELELRSMEQQRIIDELSDVVFAHQRLLDALKQALDRLAQKTSAEPGLVDPDPTEKPPHY
jgi:uncharacterized coiled-coil protein SlyX